MTSNYVWQQTDNSSGYTEDNGRSAVPEVGVFVVVQCMTMRQYTENSPGYSTAKYTNVGGRRQYTTQCGCLFLPDEP